MLIKLTTGGLSFVFAASKSILIVEINGSEYCPPFQHSLFAVDISSRDNLRILWEQNSKSNVKYDVKVANFKIYKLEMNPDSSIVLSILSAETGQTLSIWPFEKVSERFLSQLLCHICTCAFTVELKISSVKDIWKFFFPIRRCTLACPVRSVWIGAIQIIRDTLGGGGVQNFGLLF